MRKQKNYNIFLSEKIIRFCFPVLKKFLILKTLDFSILANLTYKIIEARLHRQFCPGNVLFIHLRILKLV